MKKQWMVLFALFLLSVPVSASAVTAEVYLGGGVYSADGQGVGSSGYNWWTKARLLPLHFEGLDLGIYGSLAGGESKSEDSTDPNTQYESTWQRWHAGLSVRPYGKHWDGHLDVGYGRKTNEGHIRLYEGKQEEDVLAVSVGGSIYSSKRNWLHRADLNADFIFPSKEESERSWDGKALDPQVSKDGYYEVSLTPWLCRLSGESINFSPGLTVAMGKSGEEKYNKYGVVFKFGTNEWSFLEVSAGIKQFSSEKEDQLYVNGFVTPIRF